jgi:hypothetical protein
MTSSLLRFDRRGSTPDVGPSIRFLMRISRHCGLSTMESGGNRVAIADENG